MEIAALAYDIPKGACKFIGRRLTVKAKNMPRSNILTESITDHAPWALLGGWISYEELSFIVNELNKYDQM